MPIHKRLASTSLPLGVLAVLLLSAWSAGAREWNLKVGPKLFPVAAAKSVHGPLFSLEALAGALDLNFQSLDKKSARLETKQGKTLLCQAGQAAFMIEDQVRHLSEPLARNRDGLLVSPRFIEEALSPLIGLDLRSQLSEGILEILGAIPRTGFEAVWSREADRHILTVRSAQTDPIARAASIAPAVLRKNGRGLSVELASTVGVTGVSMEKAAVLTEPVANGRTRLNVVPVEGYLAIPLPDPDGLRIALVEENSIQGPPKAPPLRAASRTTTKDRSKEPNMLSADPDQGLFRLVVLDPGHGGGETGAIGAGGAEEKTLVLQVAMRLRALLESKGVEVAVTRTEDIEMPLDDRTAFANQLKADLFVSLHANASTARGAKGAETFFLSREATDELSRTIAAIESNSIGVRRTRGQRTVTGALEMTLWEMAQSQFLQESQRLAERVQKELNELAGTPDRGVKQGPLTVLMGATMPAVLVEVGFISNPAEERKLQTAEHQQLVAMAIARAILAFGEEREARAAARTAP